MYLEIKFTKIKNLNLNIYIYNHIPGWSFQIQSLRWPVVPHYADFL